ncbi:hypothetical protein CUMW_127780 [Citrus unshiu]|uniref:Leucine-rich repeat-containing N-terminal plant-type domain-containing protein n=1 Tax=Citrus unshiu TaxID=55188 RepID=A0A2H5PDY9_CITUN|nr:hypothetical protein CUMW_127780 [Citrus unshiu]
MDSTYADPSVDLLHLTLLLDSQSSAKQCPREQSSALLHCGGEDHSYPKMMPWKKASDCCSWDGVTSDVAQYFQELIISVFPHLTTRIVRNYLKEWRKRKSQLVFKAYIALE